MNKIIENSIAIILIVLATLSIIFGSYLPLVKAQCFIDALMELQSGKIHSVEEFKMNFDRTFKFYSPVGKEEITKFLANNILQIISQQNQPEAVSRELVNYIEPYFFQNNVRHLMAAGQMYEVLWGRYGQEEDFQKAENYFQKAFAIGPKLPPVLHGILDLYRMRGDTQKTKEIGEIILKYWPEDEEVEKILKEI